METIELFLPSHWASPLINADDSGMSDAECDEFNLFMNNEMVGLHCVDVDEDKVFVKYHDAKEYALPCDCSNFTFIRN
tara:strand:+ start:1959 stop:2192 length:234 start_codon:yes stop_codon:yes gene_type:complete